MTTTVRLTEDDYWSLMEAIHVLESRDLRDRIFLIAKKYEWAKSPVRGAQRGRPLIDVLTEDDLAEARRQDDYEEQTEPGWV